MGKKNRKTKGTKKQLKKTRELGGEQEEVLKEEYFIDPTNTYV